MMFPWHHYKLLTNTTVSPPTGTHSRSTTSSTTLPTTRTASASPAASGTAYSAPSCLLHPRPRFLSRPKYRERSSPRWPRGVDRSPGSTQRMTRGLNCMILGIDAAFFLPSFFLPHSGLRLGTYGISQYQSRTHCRILPQQQRLDQVVILMNMRETKGMETGWKLTLSGSKLVPPNAIM
jgi:hypothetical protein